MVKETKFYDLLGVGTYLRNVHMQKHDLTLRQVTPTASDAELRSAYKKGALKHHPGQ